MKARRILCLLAGVGSILATTVTASAASKPNTVVTATFKAPTIQVGVSSANKVYINPNKLQIKLSSGFQYNEDDTSPQIISDTGYIWNESEVPIEVNVSVRGTTNTAVKLSSTSTAGDTSGDKKVFMFFQMKSLEESDLDDLDSVAWSTNYDPDSHLLITYDTVSKNNVVTLDANKEDSCYGAFTLRGDCTEEPQIPWKSTDRLSTNVIFTFTPVPLDD